MQRQAAVESYDSHRIIDVQHGSPRPSSKAQPPLPLQVPFDEVTFGGLLTEEEADRSATTPQLRDRRLFERSLAIARDVELAEPEGKRSRTAPSSSSITTAAAANAVRIAEFFAPRKSKKEDARAPLIRELHFGEHNLRPWYSAPFPAEYFEGAERGHLWMCESCLKYMRARDTFRRHISKCLSRVPPGQEIYRKDRLSVFEVNGRFSKEYCQRLCLLAKMFLDHKTLYYDVETFLFYVLIEWTPVDSREALEALPPRTDPATYSLLGYFSKEKQSPSEYNLSCIMTLPHQQRRGFGAFMIDFSYLLSRREGKLGTPEKPLSDLGLATYVRHWSSAILAILVEANAQKMPALSILEISTRTGMIVNDVLATLEYLGLLVWCEDAHRYELVLPKNLLEKHCDALSSTGRLWAEPSCLRWMPYVCHR